MTESKPTGEFINLSDDSELNYCLDKYDCEPDEYNRIQLVKFVEEEIKPYFNLKSTDNLSWDQIEEFHNLPPVGLDYKR
ncbi:hypothetical protein RCS94_03170 [Orbaceae bacterium ac157xtp]